MARPPSIQATGKPVNTSTMKLANMATASISLPVIGTILDPEQVGAHPRQA
jgi:hypothetical protein